MQLDVVARHFCADILLGGVGVYLARDLQTSALRRRGALREWGADNKSQTWGDGGGTVIGSTDRSPTFIDASNSAAYPGAQRCA